MYNNLGLLYSGLGLYDTSREFGERAVEMARSFDSNDNISAYLESLGRAYSGLGLSETSRRAFEECLSLAQAVNDLWLQGEAWLGLGRLSRQLGALDAARDECLTACERLRLSHHHVELTNALAWLGAIYLRRGEVQQA